MRRAIFLVIAFLLMMSTASSGLKDSVIKKLDAVGQLYGSDLLGRSYICTCFGVKDTTLIVTAGHCAQGVALSVWFAPRPGLIRSPQDEAVPVEVLVALQDEDVAVLRWPGPPFRNGFELAHKEPAIGMVVYTAGYPKVSHGSLMLTKGIAAITHANILQKFDLNGSPGHSGAPIFDENGRVVGLFASASQGPVGGFVTESPTVASIRRAITEACVRRSHRPLGVALRPFGRR